MADLPTVPPRERLLRAAHTLFSQRGLAHVAVDDIVREARSTKATLYKYYRSKDDLMLAALRWQADEFLYQLQDNVARLEPQPERQLLAVVDALAEWFAHQNTLLTRAAVELGGQDHPAVQILHEHQHRVRGYLEVLAQQAHQPEPEHLAAELHLVLEGATLLAGMGQERDAISRARSIAEHLLK